MTVQNSTLGGLTNLQTLDRVLVKQGAVEPGENRRNKYVVFDATGRQLFQATQGKPSPGGFFLKGHDFNMKIKDMEERKVIELYRPHNFLSSETIKIFAPPGNLIGRIVKKDTLNTPVYDICRADRTLLYTIKGSAITLTCRGDDEFKILGVDGPQGTQVGRMTKHWTVGLAKEFLKSETHDNFGVAFPEGVNVEIKAILLSACLFIYLVHCSD